MPFVSRYASGVGNGGGKPGICWASIFQANGGKKKEVGVKRPRVSNRLTFFFWGGNMLCVFKRNKKTVSWSWLFFWKISVFFFWLDVSPNCPRKNPAKQVDWWVHLMPQAIFFGYLYIYIYTIPVRLTKSPYIGSLTTKLPVITVCVYVCNVHIYIDTI